MRACVCVCHFVLMCVRARKTLTMPSKPLIKSFTRDASCSEDDDDDDDVDYVDYHDVGLLDVDDADDADDNDDDNDNEDWYGDDDDDGDYD